MSFDSLSHSVSHSQQQVSADEMSASLEFLNETEPSSIEINNGEPNLKPTLDDTAKKTQECTEEILKHEQPVQNDLDREESQIIVHRVQNYKELISHRELPKETPEDDLLKVTLAGTDRNADILKANFNQELLLLVEIYRNNFENVKKPFQEKVINYFLIKLNEFIIKHGSDKVPQEIKQIADKFINSFVEFELLDKEHSNLESQRDKVLKGSAEEQEEYQSKIRFVHTGYQRLLQNPVIPLERKEEINKKIHRLEFLLKEITSIINNRKKEVNKTNRVDEDKLGLAQREKDKEMTKKAMLRSEKLADQIDKERLKWRKRHEEILAAELKAKEIGNEKFERRERHNKESDEEHTRIEDKHVEREIEANRSSPRQKPLPDQLK